MPSPLTLTRSLPRQGIGRLPYGFDPRRIAGCQAFYWADSLDWLAEGAAVGVTTSPWKNLVGTNATWDFVQATSAAQPTLKKYVMNGRHGIRFDTVDDNLGCAVAGALAVLNGKPGATVYAVVRPTAIKAAFSTFFHHAQGTATANERINIYITTSNQWENSFRRTDAEASQFMGTTTVPSITVPIVVGVNMNAASNPVVMYESGRQIGTLSPATPANFSATNSLQWLIGSNDGAEPFGGDISCVLLYDRALAAPERKYIENGLAQMYRAYTIGSS